jgi:hypothetical protein
LIHPGCWGSTCSIVRKGGFSTGVNVYGYAVAWVPSGATAWEIEPDDEYRNRPAHYPTAAEACHRVAFLKEHSFQARALALVVMSGDSPAEFEANKIEPR